MSDQRPVIVEGSFPWQVAQQFAATVDIEDAKQKAMAAINPNAFKGVQYKAEDNAQVAALDNNDMKRGPSGRDGIV